MSPALPERLPPSEPAAQVAPAIAAPVPWWQRPLKPFHSRFARYLAIGSVLLGGIAAGGHFIGGFIGWWHLYELTFHAGKPSLQASTTDAKSRKLPRLSIVMLPLASEGGGQEGDWLIDNLSSDLTTELGRFSGALVISRDTAFTYKGKTVDPREVSRELGVRYVVRGTVRRDGDSVRLNLSMVDGESGRQHWAQQFAMDRTSLGKSLDEVALQVGRSLSVQLYRSEGQRAATLKPEEVEADDLAMQGWNAYYRGLSRENLLEALQHFDAAVVKDPKSIRGWAGVAIANFIGAVTAWLPDREAASRRVQLAANTMQALDEGDVMTFLVRMFAAGLRRDYEAQLLAATALVERFPNNPNGHAGRGQALMNLGRFEECTEGPKQAIRIGPRDSNLGTWKLQIANCHFMRGEYSQAADHARAAIQANPNPPIRTLTLAASLARDGRAVEARQLVTDFRTRNPGYKAEDIARGLAGNNPRFAEGRNRMLATLRELGLP